MLGVQLIQKSAKDVLKKLIEGIHFIATTEVVAGIPKEMDSGHPSGMTNGELLYLHCMGSAGGRIPARNVLAAAQNDRASQKGINSDIRKGMLFAILGDLEKARQQYEKAGMAAASAIKSQFGSIPPPNAPSTVAKKGSSATLIDTGSLMGAITYVVREK